MMEESVVEWSTYLRWLITSNCGGSVYRPLIECLTSSRLSACALNVDNYLHMREECLKVVTDLPLMNDFIE